jgi:hypothetical protein
MSILRKCFKGGFGKQTLFAGLKRTTSLFVDQMKESHGLEKSVSLITRYLSNKVTEK